MALGRRTRVLALLAALVLVVGVAALVVEVTGDDEDRAGSSPTTEPAEPSTSAPTTAPTTSEAPTTTTTTLPPVPWPALPDDGVARAVTTPTGVVLAITEALPDGRYRATSPCGNEVTVTGTPISGATVVLDPGHGGDERGAVGPSGLEEKAVNLAVAEAAKRHLEAQGATVVLTRTGDHRITLASRGAIAQALQPVVFVSIHHNADPDEERATPGSETYFQIGSEASRRLAGLVYEEVYAALAVHDITWAADRDAGAKYRPNSRGGDYYGILKRTAGIPAVLSEGAFITNPAEEALLADPTVQDAEGAAIARAIVRFVSTDDPGSGFIEPYPRTEPAGPGGGSDGCVDPPLG